MVKKQNRRSRRYRKADIPMQIKDQHYTRNISYLQDVTITSVGICNANWDIGYALVNAPEWGSLINAFKAAHIKSINVSFCPANPNFNTGLQTLAIGYNPNTYGNPGSALAVLDNKYSRFKPFTSFFSFQAPLITANGNEFHPTNVYGTGTLGTIQGYISTGLTTAMTIGTLKVDVLATFKYAG